MRRTPTDISEYLEVLARRKWPFLITLVVVNVLVIGVSLVLPRYYTSQTMILVDPQKLPADFVHGTVGTNVGDRLQTLMQEIMSRTRLVKIIDQFSLYKAESKQMTQEEVVDLMRKDIKVEPIMETAKDSRAPTLTGFKITYESRDPQTAQQVNRQLSALFVEENLKIREQEAQGTDDFLETQLEKARADLQQQEDKLKEFKVKHNGALPEQQQANLGLLAQVNGLLSSNADAITRLEQQRTYMQSMQQSDAKMKAFNPAPKSGVEMQLEATKSQLADAEALYSPNHPDVIRLKGDVKALQAQVDADKKLAAAEGDKGPPDRTGLQLKMVEDEIKSRTRKQADIEKQVQLLQMRVSLAPALEEEFRNISRDYMVSKQNYDQLLAKKASAAVAVDMEHSAKGEQFRVVDPASFPEKPTRPDLLRVNLMGLAGALVAAVLMVLVTEGKNAVVQNDKDVEFYAAAPVLGSLPIIATEQTIGAHSRQRWKTAIGMATAACVWLASWGYLILSAKLYKQVLGG